MTKINISAILIGKWLVVHVQFMAIDIAPVFKQTRSKKNTNRETKL